jgi:hypothetical protein
MKYYLPDFEFENQLLSSNLLNNLDSLSATIYTYLNNINTECFDKYWFTVGNKLERDFEL